MPSAALLAYPALLAAIYGIYRIGRRRGMFRVSGFEWMRLALLAALFGLHAAIEVRLVASGFVRSPISLAAATLSVAGVFGLVGIHLMEMMESWRHQQKAASSAASPSES